MLSTKPHRSCAKCHITSKEAKNLCFHRAQVWAEYCYPAGNWSNEKTLKSLHSKMICGKHFDDSSYTCSSRKRLNNFAIPTGSEDLMRKLRQSQESVTSSKTNDVNSTATSSCLKQMKKIQDLEETLTSEITPIEPCISDFPTEYKATMTETIYIRETTPFDETTSNVPSPVEESTSNEPSPVEESTSNEPSPVAVKATMMETIYIRDPAPVEESTLNEPSPVEESTSNEPSPVEESTSNEPSPVEESTSNEPSPVEESTSNEPSPVEESTSNEPSPVEESTSNEPSPVVVKVSRGNFR